MLQKLMLKKSAVIVPFIFITFFFSLFTFDVQAIDQPQGQKAIIDQITVSLPQETIIYSFEDAQIAAVHASTAWKTFQASNPSWNWLWWKPGLKAPQRAFGEAIPIPGVTSVTGSNVKDVAWSAMEILGDIIGVSKEELCLGRTFRIKNFWMISFYQVYKEMIVFQSEVELRISIDGKLISFGIDIAPELALERPKTLRKAVELSEAAQVGLPDIAKTQIPPKVSGPFVMPVAKSKGFDYRVVYRVDTDDPKLSYPWRAWIDASDGTVLKRELAVDFQDVTGTVSGEVDPYPFTNPPVSRDFPLQYVNITSLPSGILSTVTTDALGSYSATLQAGSTSCVVNALLDGPVIQVINASGTNASYTNVATSPFPVIHNITWSNTISDIAERDLLYHVNLIFEDVAARDDALAVSPSFRANFSKLVGSTVNNSWSCNAYYSATSHNLMFGQASGSCLNTARVPRIVYHEWGHARHYEQYDIAGATWWPAPSQLKESMADITSAFFVNDPIMPLVATVGATSDRNMDNTYCYTTDFSWLSTAHRQSQILSGALWHMRDNLMATYGTGLGDQIAQELFHVAMYGGAADAIAIVAWIEFMLDIFIADDDDGNLGNGTPNFGDIRDAFQLHCIWPTILPAAQAGIDVALVMDRSGSMGWDSPTRMSRARIAAKAFIGLSGDYDRIGLASFSTTSSTDHSLVELTSANRTSLNNAIDGLPVAGWTCVSCGIDAGQLVLNPGLPTANTPQFILLLSDGEANRPVDEPTAYAAAMSSVSSLPTTTRVYTIFLSSSMSGESLMRDVALAGGGIYQQSPTVDDLLYTYISMYTLIMNRDLILSYGGLVNPSFSDNAINATDTTWTIGELVWIDHRTTDADFMGLWEPGEQGIAVNGMVELEDPNGVIINNKNIKQYSGGSYIPLPDGEDLRINQPMLGQWVMRVTVSGSYIKGTKIDAFCVTTNDIDMSLSYKVINEKDRIYAVQAQLTDSYNSIVPVPILGASVVAQRSGQDFVLLDDGKHYDGAANDGIYGGQVGSVPDTTSATFSAKATIQESNAQLTRFGQVSILHTPLVNFPAQVIKQPGWSLTSLPVLPERTYLPSIFQRAESFFFFDHKKGYSFVDTVGVNQYYSGFWLNMSDTASSFIKGSPITEYSKELDKGWHILGGLYNKVTTPRAEPNKGIGAIFGFDQEKGYFLTERVIPGEAVWVECKEPCTVNMTTSFLKPLSTTTSATTNWEATLLATGEEVGAAVRVSNVIIGANNTAVSTISAPPSPPDYTTQLRLFPADFANAYYKDLRLIQTPTQIETWILEVDPNGNKPPSRTTTMSWDPDELSTIGNNWVLREGTDGSGTIVVADMISINSYIVSGTSEQYFTITAMVTGPNNDVEDQNEFHDIPEKFALFQNYPNPFNPVTCIKYQLPENSRVKISIYNLLGQEVTNLVDKKQLAGHHTVQWNAKDVYGRDVASGIYIYRIQAANFIDTKKIILLR